MKKGKTRFAVLGILSYGPMSGYDIKKFYEKNVAGFWSESYGQIYPILKRLAEEGHLRHNRQGTRRIAAMAGGTHRPPYRAP
jgi:DNA-binding PadR family transcriptional regulator